jgi:uncharacterized protein
MSGPSYPPAPPQQMNPAQLGVRPAPAMVQSMLVGAFGWMFAGLLLSAGVAYLVSTSAQLLQFTAQYWFFIMIAQLGLGIGIQVAIRKAPAMLSLLLFFVFAATMGLTIGAIVWAYIQTPAGVQAVVSAFGASAAMFGAASVYGLVTKRDLTKIGLLAVMALFGLIVASLINWFLKSEILYWVISYAGVVIFTALTAYDVQKIARGDYVAYTRNPDSAAVLAALGLYLNFVNMFMMFLRIFGGRR